MEKQSHAVTVTGSSKKNNDRVVCKNNEVVDYKKQTMISIPPHS